MQVQTQQQNNLRQIAPPAGQSEVVGIQREVRGLRFEMRISLFSF